MRDGARRLVVVGGDGSVNEVVNGLDAATDVELAVIPRGTGWDFVRTFGIPNDLDGAIDVALSGSGARDRPRDGELPHVGRRRGAIDVRERRERGHPGAIAQRANDSSKALGGKVSYYWATLSVFFGWQTGEMRVTVDGESRAGR